MGSLTGHVFTVPANCISIADPLDDPLLVHEVVFLRGSQLCRAVFIGWVNLTDINFNNCTLLTSIADYAFFGCSSIKTIHLPAALVNIGADAFRSCTNLANIELPLTVKTLGVSAFRGCSKLSSINLGQTNVTAIPTYAFCDCINLTTIVLPTKLCSLGEGAFYDCERLTTILFPTTVLSIGVSCFCGCASLSAIDLQKTKVTVIGSQVFYGCQSLREIIFPENLATIEESSFYKCQRLRAINLPENLATVKDKAFHSCTNLTDVILPTTVETIGKFAFYRCSLTRIELPATMTTIGANAFAMCTSLASVEFSKTSEVEVTIGHRAFGGCTSLTYIRLPNKCEVAFDFLQGCTACRSVGMRVGSSLNGTATRCVIHLAGTFLIAQLMEAIQTNAAQLAGAAGGAAEEGTRFLSRLAVQLIDPPHGERPAIDWPQESSAHMFGRLHYTPRYPFGQTLEDLRNERHVQFHLREFVMGVVGRTRLPLLPPEIWQMILCILSNRTIITGFGNGTSLQAALATTSEGHFISDIDSSSDSSSEDEGQDGM